MSLKLLFDQCSYGPVGVNVGAQKFWVGEREKKLQKSSIFIIAAFIDSANEGFKGLSLKTMVRIVGGAEDSFKTNLSRTRRFLSEFEIARNVFADSLLLSEKMKGNLLPHEIESGKEKKPYHFNVDLADLIEKYGFNIPSEKLNEIRLDPVRHIGRFSNPKLFAAHIS